MSAKSEAYAAYLKDIYADYDALADTVIDNSPITLSASERGFAVLGTMGGSDILEIELLVLMESSKAAQDDLKAIMQETQAINQVKQRLHDSLQRLKQSDSDGEDDSPAKPVRRSEDLQAECAGLDSDLFVETLTRLSLKHSDDELQRLADEVAVLRRRKQRAATVGASRDVQDTLNELSDLMELRLQMLLDRRSKFMETLSNLLKKMADTQSAIIANLK